jgi:hypothetical protein
MAAPAAVATAAMMAAPATAAASAAVAVASPAVAAMAAMAAMADELYHRGCSVALLVEDVERRQADVGDFFLTESDLIAIFGIWHRHIRC